MRLPEESHPPALPSPAADTPSALVGGSPEEELSPATKAEIKHHTVHSRENIRVTGSFLVGEKRGGGKDLRAISGT